MEPYCKLLWTIQIIDKLLYNNSLDNFVAFFHLLNLTFNLTMWQLHLCLVISNFHTTVSIEAVNVSKNCKKFTNFVKSNSQDCHWSRLKLCFTFAWYKPANTEIVQSFAHFCVIGLISCETWVAKLTNKNNINKKQKAWQEHKYECHTKPAVGHINNNQEKHKGYLYSKLMSSTRNDRRQSMNTDKNMRTDQNKRQTNISKEMTMNMKQANKISANLTRATNLKVQPLIKHCLRGSNYNHENYISNA